MSTNIHETDRETEIEREFERSLFQPTPEEHGLVVHARDGVKTGNAFVKVNLSREVWYALLLRPSVTGGVTDAHKDDAAIVPALMRNRPEDRILSAKTGGGVEMASRSSANVLGMTAAIFDVENNRQRMDDIVAALKKEGLEASVYTTFNHNPRGDVLIDYDDISDYLGVPFAGVCKLDQDMANAVKAYVFDKSRGLGCKADPATFEIVRWYDDIDGRDVIWARHEPLYRYRVVIWLAEPFGPSVPENWHAMTPRQKSSLWAACYRALAKHLGLDVDLACADLARVHYLPTVPREREDHYKSEIVGGRPLSPERLLEIYHAHGADPDVLEPEMASAREREKQPTDTRLREIHAALGVIPADCDREMWRNIIWAVKSEFQDSELEDDAREMMDAWSESAPFAYDAKAFESVWESGDADRDGGITLGTFWHIAREHGFTLKTYRQTQRALATFARLSKTH